MAGWHWPAPSHSAAVLVTPAWQDAGAQTVAAGKKLQLPFWPQVPSWPQGGSAVQATCDNLLAAVRAAAKERLGLPNEEIQIANGEVTAGGRRIALAEFAGSEAEGSFSTTIRTYSYGAHACHVAVDPNTAHVEIVDYVAIEDVGRVINPHIVHGQAIGALVQGLGGVFLDHVAYDADGQLLTATLADYLVPLSTNFPNIRGVTLELRRSNTNPLGAKGAGEGGMVAVAATVANAVAAALAAGDRGFGGCAAVRLERGPQPRVR